MPTQAELAKIHIAIKDLGLTDDDYRAMLYQRYKAHSSKALTDRQVDDLLLRFKVAGWRPKPSLKPIKGQPRGAAPTQTRPMADDPQSKKIRALWINMFKAGIVKNRSERALNHYVKRLSGVDALQWCDGRQKSVIIEALKKWRDRGSSTTVGAKDFSPLPSPPQSEAAYPSREH